MGIQRWSGLSETGSDLAPSDQDPCPHCGGHTAAGGSEQGPSRRSFLDRLLGTAGGAVAAAVLYPIARFLVPPKVVEAAVNSTTAPILASELPPNAGRVFRFGDRPAILILTPKGELRCFDAICTHLACTVQYRDDLAHIWCACHNGHYDLQGRNIAGPPPRPLPEHRVSVRGDEIVVSRS